MEGEAARATSAIVGREAELAALTAMLDGEIAGRALMLAGEPGIGKTTVWEAGIDAARERDMLVLSARPAAAEADFSFAGLTDLLERVGAEALATLPVPQRRALEVALLRAEPSALPPGPRAIAAGLLGVLRELAARAPLLVAIDDVQWLDAASAQALAFAARRLDHEPVRFLLARRAGETSRLEVAFAPEQLARLELTGLSLGAIRTLLIERLGLHLSRRVLRQVFEASGGNALFAIELGRLLATRGAPEAGEELPVPEAVADLVGVRVARLLPPLRRALLAVALRPGLGRAQLASLVGDVALEEAVASGVLVVQDERVRTAHPLLATASRGQAAPFERRALHLALATVVSDEELRAHHLALGTERPDANVAAQVAAAATRAAARGAAGDAVELSAHALRLTPPEAAERSGRLLVLAERLLVAGEHRRVGELLAPELETLPAGEPRAAAHLLLAESDFPLVHVDEVGAHLQQALVDSTGHPALRARAAALWSRHLAATRVERIQEAERYAVEALPAARLAGHEVEREVLHALALARMLRGLPIDDLRERFDAVSSEAFHLLRGIERIAAERLGLRGHVQEARTSFRRLLSLADERGEGWSSSWLRLQLAELELRAGEWETASQLLEECAEPADRWLLGAPAYERSRALLAAGQGKVEEAGQWAARTIEACEARGLRWNLLEALRAWGIAALLAHEPACAAESLAAVWEHTEREGVEEPAEFPVAPDLVEALLGLGRLEDARAVSARLRQLAEAQEHPWGLATSLRCEALIALTETHDQDALRHLTEAAVTYEGLGLRFDHARTLLAAGRAARRQRMWGVARDLLDRALAAFEGIGSHGWAEDARAELARIGGRRSGAVGGLTEAEQRVVELAAAGRSNKEIAKELAVSVYTVERHLTHAYGKLGVHARSQLAHRYSRQG